MSEIPKTKTIATFEIKYLQYLDEHFKPTQPFPEFATPETLLHLYRFMTLIRFLDTKAVNLQRQGKMGTYPSSRGQEAVSIGIGSALNKDDIFCTYYRDQGTMIYRGVKIAEILTYWGGDERGSFFANANVKDDFPICVPISGQCLHAAGVAYAVKFRKQKRAVLTTLGDGGTSKGDFYEAMNFAGVQNLPLVFVVNNNQWAISVPLSKQTATKTIAQKAIAAGIEGLQVDGNDVIAVRKGVHDAVEKARKGGGATLIEALNFRLCDHTTADDATRYMSREDFKNAWKLEPISRLGHYLESQGLWSKEKDESLHKECIAEVEKAVEEYLNVTPQSPYDLIDYLYEKVPDALLDQRDALGEKS